MLALLARFGFVARGVLCRVVSRRVALPRAGSGCVEWESRSERARAQEFYVGGAGEGAVRQGNTRAMGHWAIQRPGAQESPPPRGRHTGWRFCVGRQP